MTEPKPTKFCAWAGCTEAISNHRTYCPDHAAAKRRARDAAHKRDITAGRYVPKPRPPQATLTHPPRNLFEVLATIGHDFGWNPPPPAEPTQTVPGSLERIHALAERVEAGVGLWHPDDLRLTAQPAQDDYERTEEQTTMDQAAIGGLAAWFGRLLRSQLGIHYSPFVLRTE